MELKPETMFSFGSPRSALPRLLNHVKSPPSPPGCLVPLSGNPPEAPPLLHNNLVRANLDIAVNRKMVSLQSYILNIIIVHH